MSWSMWNCGRKLYESLNYTKTRIAIVIRTDMAPYDLKSISKTNILYIRTNDDDDDDNNIRFA